ncbi:MAG: hypothetical protein MUP55_00230, partial [Candidatus Aenigmarchaeota archaeon]|nr:hypothetical protein [Candidatus Aenigmarchaeota archaeon]
MEIEKVNIERNRIWIPKEIQEKIFGKFIEISIRKNQKEMSFLSKMNKDGRIVIPYKYAEYLQLNKRYDVARIEIEVIRNRKRGSNLFRVKSFDVLSFVPQNTISGFEILAIENNGKLNLWYSTKGRPNNVQINRFLPMNFSRLLGYYQAEGGKPKLMKRRGRELSFTNTSIEIIGEFIDLSKSMFNPELWNATIRYKEGVNKSEIDKLV